MKWTAPRPASSALTGPFKDGLRVQHYHGNYFIAAVKEWIAIFGAHFSSAAGLGFGLGWELK